MVRLALALSAFGLALCGDRRRAPSSADVFTYRTVLTAGAEVPKPTAPAGAGGVFTSTVTKNGSAYAIAWKLTYRKLSGPAVAAHVHRGGAGVGRRSDSRVVRAVYERSDRQGEAHEVGRGRHAARNGVRQRPHREELRRRDPWSGEADEDGDRAAGTEHSRRRRRRRRHTRAHPRRPTTDAVPGFSQAPALPRRIAPSYAAR